MYFKFHDEDPQRYIQAKNKINKAFCKLRKSGFVAKQNFMCCMGCGFAAMPDGTKKAVFYHKQDTQHFKATGELYLAWGGNGKQVAETFKQDGMRVIWNGKKTQRILVKF